ncbi:PP2C family serine/threonine-protein phosphatase [Marispirochaeta aestuarii]|uniref:PP2C family serine/threonine-protein phosphatase n=1 Tax=Marispirochaeta aestuarii TaxID=1963862 RepID=UPI0029C64DB6|nr:PP2C family serine/threonine-protein phosphatase [Marispirochaeta aestuarii]
MNRRFPSIPATIILAALVLLLPQVQLQAQERIYWDDSRVLGLESPRFPQAGSSYQGIVVMAHEYEYSGQDQGRAYISTAYSSDSLQWETHSRVLGPFSFSGDESPIASLAVAAGGEVYLAVAEDESTIGIYLSRNQGGSFSRISSITAPVSAIVAPRLFLNSRGEFVLFVSRDVGTGAGLGSYLGIFYTSSENGSQWEAFRPLTTGNSLRETYLPFLAGYRGRDYVVFQAFKTGGPGGNPPSSYQLYMASSFDGGRSWGQPELITDFPEPENLGEEPGWEYYDNQRPAILVDGEKTFVAWERRYARSRTRNIYLAELNGSGNTENVVRIRSDRDSISPRMVKAGDRYFISWYEGSEQDMTLRLAEGRMIPNVGIDWYYQEGAGTEYLFADDRPDSSTFAVPLVFRQRLHLVWENDTYRGTELADSRLIYRGPDIYTASPSVRGVNFTGGEPVSRDNFTIAWNEPRDSSGIAGYNYIFSRSETERPGRQLSHFRDENLSTTRSLKEDGRWYFHIIAQDYAGNWSEPSSLLIQRDTTAPDAPVFLPPETDSSGYLLSNTRTIEWRASPQEDTAGYTYTYTLLDPAGRAVDTEQVRPALPPRRIVTTSPEASFFNRDNGTWMLSVAAVDRVGNISEPAALVFRLNKYIPVTLINEIEAERDEVGRSILTIRGRGFTADGQIERIILDRDANPPYDYIYTLEGGSYKLSGNRLIEDFVVEDVDEGLYGIGLDHSRRGIKWSDQSLYFEPTGVVKFGDFTYTPPSRFTLFAWDYFGMSVNALVTLLILTGLAVALGLTIFMLRGVLAENARIQRDIETIVSGRLLTGPEYRKRIVEMKRKGLGLRIKFVLLITVLILIVVMMVAVSLGYYMIESRQRTLAQGLEERASLLLESLAVGAREPIDSNDQESMFSLVGQVEAMADATGVIITGRSVSDPAGQIHALWAASHPEELLESLSGQIRIDYREKDAASEAPRTFALIDAEELESYRDRYDVLVTPFYGRSVYTDNLSSEEERIAGQVDRELSSEILSIEEDIRAMQQEQLVLESLNRGLSVSADQRRFIQDRFPSFEDSDARNLRLAQINTDVVQFNRARTALIRETGNILNSVPAFNPEEFNTSTGEYTFYRPIVGPRQVPDQGIGAEQDSGYFYRGMVRLTVSTENIVRQIVDSQSTLITITGVVALVSALIGVIGALILATIIITPINRLVQGVEIIRDTVDKEQLENHVVDTRTRDELSGLAQTINEMTRGLVEAAKANKELTLGKEIQKMFLPLVTDQNGRKLTTASFEDDFIQVYGYYEGADALSGDYFDHIDLKNGYHAFIKCDVAGHGASASLIMVEVATIFTSYFKRYVGQKPQLQISELVSSINELLEERQFRGKFAALIVGLLEAASGKIHLCHAGDNLVHIYEEKKHGLSLLKLPETPAAGVFGRDLIDMRGGYPKVVHQLNKGDTVLFFTDGIEESHHRLRGENLEVRSYQDFPEKMREEDARLVDQGFKEIKPEEPYEEFDLKRVNMVIEAAMNRESFELKRRMDAVIKEPLVFDFSSLEGSTEEMVTALIAVEKVYRLVPDPAATERDRVRVDRKIDTFLRKHFSAYYRYFRNPLEDSSFPEYVWFSHLKEDEQDDDLTIIAVKRK